jgi:putative Holliday junction resolvase
MRIMGLDYGSKTIGVSISDPLGIIASGVETIRRTEEGALKKSMVRLGELIKLYDVSQILLGYPKNMNNTEGPRCEKTLAFKKMIESRFKDTPVILWDERLSTMGAMRALNHLSNDKKSQVIDKLAAAYILQGYLDMMNAKKKEVSEMDVIDDDDFSEYEDEYDVVIMVDDEGNEVPFAILDVIQVDGVKYLMMVEEELYDVSEADVTICKAVDSEGDEEIFEFVTDNDEIIKVAHMFEEISGEEFEIDL